MRAFIAVTIEPTRELRRLHGRLAELGDRFRPVSLSNLHVTLKFLGETAQAQLPAIEEIAQRATAARSRFALRLTGVGAFPHERRPAVVWVGIRDAQPLIDIAADLERDLAGLGFDREERPFQPHLTLLRIKSRPPDLLFRILEEESQTDFGLVPLAQVELIQSELGREAARYTTLGKFSLKDEK